MIALLRTFLPNAWVMLGVTLFYVGSVAYAAYIGYDYASTKCDEDKAIMEAAFEIDRLKKENEVKEIRAQLDQAANDADKAAKDLIDELLKDTAKINDPTICADADFLRRLQGIR